MRKVFLFFCFAILATNSSIAQTSSKPKLEKTAERKIQYMYESNAGFTAYFSNGTFFSRFGEYSPAEFKAGFKKAKPSGTYKVQKDGLNDSDHGLVSFKDEEGELDYSWKIIDYNKVNQ